VYPPLFKVKWTLCHQVLNNHLLTFSSHGQACDRFLIWPNNVVNWVSWHSTHGRDDACSSECIWLTWIEFLFKAGLEIDTTNTFNVYVQHMSFRSLLNKRKITNLVMGQQHAPCMIAWPMWRRLNKQVDMQYWFGLK